MNGKMGGVIFFANYAKYINDQSFNQLSDLLFEDVYENIADDTPVDFATGLCGIGWAVEYLLQNNYTEGNTDEVLEDIDGKIMEKDIRRISDFSFDKGLAGILFYVLTRLESYDRKGKTLPFDSIYLDDIYNKINNIELNKENKFIYDLASRYNVFLAGKVNYDIKPDIPSSWLTDPQEEMTDLTKIPLGLNKGLTGRALKLISR